MPLSRGWFACPKTSTWRKLPESSTFAGERGALGDEWERTALHPLASGPFFWISHSKKLGAQNLRERCRSTSTENSPTTSGQCWNITCSTAAPAKQEYAFQMRLRSASSELTDRKWRKLSRLTPPPPLAPERILLRISPSHRPSHLQAGHLQTGHLHQHRRPGPTRSQNMRPSQDPESTPTRARMFTPLEPRQVSAREPRPWAIETRERQALRSRAA